MDLKQLKYFVTVADEGHFGRAAKRLHRSQPPVSMKIMHLEDELGVNLFNRDTRNVSLTEAGVVFLERARAILNSVEEAKHALQDAEQGLRGQLSVGFVSSATMNVLPKTLKLFQSNFPKVQLHLRELTTGQQLQAFEQGNIRVGLVRLPCYAPHIEVTEVLEEHFICALPSRHPLSSKREISIADLENEGIISYPSDLVPSAYNNLLQLFESAHFTPKFVQEAVHLQTILSLVGEGMGIALIPESSRRAQQEGVVYRPLLTSYLSKLGLVRRRNDDSPLVRNFCGTVLKFRSKMKTS